MMNKIIITVNINNNTINIDNLNTINSRNNNLIINTVSIVDGEGSIIEFNRFKFGFFIRDESDTIVQQGIYPKDEEIFVSSSDGCLASEFLVLEADTSYKLQVYVEDAGNFYDVNLPCPTPKHEKPHENGEEYTSWAWDSDNKIWESPVPYPTDDKNYKWNEDTTAWVEVT